MKQFISDLFSDSPKVSSKRFIALTSLLMLFILIIGVLFGVNVPNELFYSLVALITGSSAMTLKNTNTTATGSTSIEVSTPATPIE